MAKETINKMKRQSMEWEKILVNDVTNKGLVSKINNSSYNSKTSKEKQVTQLKNGQKT